MGGFFGSGSVDGLDDSPCLFIDVLYYPQRNDQLQNVLFLINSFICICIICICCELALTTLLYFCCFSTFCAPKDKFLLTVLLCLLRGRLFSLHINIIQSIIATNGNSLWNSSDKWPDTMQIFQKFIRSGRSNMQIYLNLIVLHKLGSLVKQYTIIVQRHSFPKQ